MAKDHQLETEKSIRDTVESIWVAIVLAFVLRAFVIEAFVIPTGSMAPTLLGQHFEFTCDACATDFALGADQVTSRGRQSVSAVCPNCGRLLSSTQYARGGDRVLVLKYLYNFRQPHRWDVVVFANPQDNRQNYIKRLVGLPGETIEIVHGDIFAKPNNTPDSAFQVQRKGRKAQDAMWQLVFDNDYQPDRHLALDAPQWRPVDDAHWKADEFGRTFKFSGAGPQWADIDFDASPDVFRPHYGYNKRDDEEKNIRPDVDLCTDLDLSCVYMPQEASSKLAMSLTSLGYRFRAEVSADGTARIIYDGPKGHHEQSGSFTPPKDGKGLAVSFTHADLRVTLTVNGRDIIQSTPEVYNVSFSELKGIVHDGRVEAPQVRLAASGQACELRHIRLMRDVYYTGGQLQTLASSSIYTRYARAIGVSLRAPGWGVTDNPKQLRRDPNDPDYDEFFVLGDNSPQSLDSRLWIAAAPTLRLWKAGKPLYNLGTVPRYNMIGRAIFVYWPASFNPRLPIIPNVGKMRLIR